MPHQLALVPGSTLLAMVDPGYPASPIPITAKCSPIDGVVPASTLPWSWPGLVQTWSTLPGAGMTPELEELAGRELDWRTSEPPPLAYEPPAGMVPYHWQDSAARRFALAVAGGFRGQALLSDDMGTGKTATVILSLVEAHIRTLCVFPVLVVCPASVIPAWVKAWAQWAPAYSVRDHRGPKRWDKGLTRPEVLVTSYETMTRDVDKLAKVGLTSLVLDEHHAIKNSDTKRTRAARSLAGKAANVIGMSGTPIAHGPDDLHPMLAALDPLAWPSKERYVARYCDVVPDDVGGTVAVGLRADRRSELDLCLAGVQRRVTKAEAAPFLPPKVYSVRTVTMPPAWRKTYEEYRDEMIAALPDDAAELSVMSVLSQMTHLQALASAPCHAWREDVLDRDGQPALDKDGLPRVVQHVDPLPGGWKAAELLELLEECPTDQVVVFAPSRKLVDAVAVDLQEAGISYRLLTGAVTATKRQAGIDDFQAGRARVMLATTGAGGVGVTLTAARIVVFLARPWSLIEALQAEDRAHRIGSEVHDTIEIVDIVTEGTIEDAVRRVLVEKAVSLADVLHDPEMARQVLGGKARP